jgi:SulP family sulfate permease
MSMPVKIQSGDLWGGFAASAVILPQAMAFGVALLSQVDLLSSQGALAGLLSAALLCLIMGLVGGTSGMISAPTGPTLVLISDALLACYTTGVTGPDLLLAMTIILVITGVLQILIGLSGGGQLIKYIPYPVISGFMTGTAILMLMSQQ